jgi:hypothetical protein
MGGQDMGNRRQTNGNGVQVMGRRRPPSGFKES